eukprot:15905791-Heterocapsa_arctica.AAC.1
MGLSEGPWKSGDLLGEEKVDGPRKAQIAKAAWAKERSLRRKRQEVAMHRQRAGPEERNLEGRNVNE